MLDKISSSESSETDIENLSGEKKNKKKEGPSGKRRCRGKKRNSRTAGCTSLNLKGGLLRTSLPMKRLSVSIAVSPCAVVNPNSKNMQRVQSTVTVQGN